MAGLLSEYPAQPVQFAGLGPSILAQQTRGRVRRHRLPPERLEGRTLLHDHCPLCPGVYGWLDSRHQICYVGKSKSLRRRLLSYFAKSPAEDKVHRIRRTAQSLVWEPISHELLALIREQELINRWRPEFNVQGQPVKRQPGFLCIGDGAAPNAYFTRRLNRSARHVYGPIAGTGNLRAAVDSLNQVFQLRDCPDSTSFEFKDQGLLFGTARSPQCLRFELRSCPAPCAGLCRRADYLANLQRAVDFIEGRDLSVLDQLAAEMQAAAAALSFERAARLRDHHRHLSWLVRRMRALRVAQESYNGVLPLEARKNRTVWLVLREGRLLGTAPQPESEPARLAASRFLAQAAAQSSQRPENLLQMNLQMILISWFTRHRDLVETLIPFEQAIAGCHRPAAA